MAVGIPSSTRRSCCKNSFLCFPSSFSEDNGAIRSKITFEQFNLAIKFKSHFSRHIPPPSLPPSMAMPGGFSAPHCQQRDGGRHRGRHSLYKRFEKAKQCCKFLQHEPRLPLPGWTPLSPSLPAPLSFLQFKEYYARYSAIMLRWKTDSPAPALCIYSPAFIFLVRLVPGPIC